MNHVQIAKDIRAAAKESITRSRAETGATYRHRAIEIITCDADGRVHGEDPIFLELNQISGKQIKLAFEGAAEGSPPFTHYGVTGGLDEFESLHEMMQPYADYCPWADTWDLEYAA